MLNLYEDYASQEERESAVMLEQAEIQMDRAMLALETCNAMRELSMREAECKLVMESGDVCDLIEYYEEATEDSTNKEKGLIQKAWEAILNLIKTIKEKLFGAAKQKADPNQEVEVDESFLDRHKKLAACVDTLKKFFANPVAKVIGLLVAGAGAVGVFLAVKSVGKKRKLKGDQVNKMVDDDEKALATIQAGIKKVFGKAADKVKEGQSVVGKVVKAIEDHIKTAYQCIKIKTGLKKLPEGVSKDEAIYLTKNGVGSVVESAEDDLSGDDYAEDAGDLSDIAELLATL